MRDKVVLGVTLAIVLLLTLVIYGAIDTQRQPTTQAAYRAESVNNGKAIYAQYCIQCHGPLGEGCIGPALNRNTWKPVVNGTKNPDYVDGSDELIRKTVQRGRASNQPGMQMPPWSVRENGPLTDEQVEDVIAFIQYGDFSTVLENAVSASSLNEPLPTYPGFNDPNKVDQVKQLMLSKGCLTCHTLGKGGGKVGADLTDVGSRRTVDWLKNWIHDPKSVAASQRGPNLWLVAATPTVPPPPGVGPSLTPSPTAVMFPMNPTYMPTIPMTQDELNLLVDYLSHARTSTK